MHAQALEKLNEWDKHSSGMERVCEHLRNTMDGDIAEAICGDKSAENMWKIIRAKARELAKNSCAMVDEDTVYAWAMEYLLDPQGDAEKEEESKRKAEEKRKEDEERRKKENAERKKKKKEEKKAKDGKSQERQEDDENEEEGEELTMEQGSLFDLLGGGGL